MSLLSEENNVVLAVTEVFRSECNTKMMFVQVKETIGYVTVDKVLQLVLTSL